MKKRALVSLCLALCLGVPTATTLLTGCAASRYKRSTGEYIDDKALALRVNSALDDDPSYKLGDVEVKAFRGTVQLSGFVSTRANIDRAVILAQGVGGVTSVTNDMRVK